WSKSGVTGGAPVSVSPPGTTPYRELLWTSGPYFPILGRQVHKSCPWPWPWPVAGGLLRNGGGTARHILNRTPAAFSLTCHNSAPACASRAALLMPTRRGLPRSWPTPAGPKYAPPVTSGSVAAIRIGRAPMLAVWPIRRAPQSTTFHGNWIPPSAGPEIGRAH